MRYPITVEEVWIFGSKARMSSHKQSDTDILVVSDDISIEETYPVLENRFGSNLDVAHYSYEGLEKIVASSSLFAHHLKKEGRPLFQRKKKLTEILNNLKDYKSHVKDLNLLQVLSLDVRSAATSNSPSLIFEYGVLGTIVRNTGIIVCNYLKFSDFSVNAPLQLSKCNPGLKMPISVEAYDILQECRRSGERGNTINANRLSCEDLLEQQQQVDEWLSRWVKLIRSQYDK